MMKRQIQLAPLLVLVLILGCGDDGESFSDVRTVSAPATAGSTMSNPHAGGIADLQMTMGASLNWTTPPGWVERAPSAMRIANLGLESEPAVECYVTRLDGVAGGLDANLNRWRTQMSLAPYTPEEIAALPTMPILGADAVVVEMSGDFKGMGATDSQSGFTLLGAVAQADGASYFIKMIGPSDVIERERDNFSSFCASLESGGGQTMAAAQPLTTDPHAGLSASGTATVAPFEWTAPSSWTQTPDRPMRVVTYTVKGAECYVTVLRGKAGGVAANINRWCTQMGQQELSPAELSALETVTVLGQAAPLVEVGGAYEGMDGTRTSEALLLGVVLEDATQSVFIKMTGPESIVRAERDNFIAFCESIK